MNRFQYLFNARGAGYQRSFAYDTLTRPVQATVTVGGTAYSFAATYDAASRLSIVTYPSGLLLNYTYTSLGYASQIVGPGGLAYWTANARDAELRLTQQTAGNGVVTTQGFDAQTGRLMDILAGTGNIVQNFSYTYDVLGNVLTRADANESLTETFTYDNLNRVTSAAVSQSIAPLKTFAYDVIGNLLSKSDVGTYTYPLAGSALPHAVMSTSGGAVSTTFTYDPNGNQTSGLGRSISYTSYNKPASITQGSSTLFFSDDVDHQRFKQVAPEGTTLYFDAFGGHAENGQALNRQAAASGPCGAESNGTIPRTCRSPRGAGDRRGDCGRARVSLHPAQSAGGEAAAAGADGNPRPLLCRDGAAVPVRHP